ncbi:hypothetical protein Tco_0663751, partial [Tanacetum coccineum]
MLQMRPGWSSSAGLQEEHWG